MKIVFKAQVVALIFSAVLIFVSGNTLAINLSGEWSLNKDKSSLGDALFISTRYIMDQKDNELSVVRYTSTQEGEEMKIPANYTLDGKECENIIFSDLKMKSVLKLSEDGKILTIVSSVTFDMNGSSNEIKMTEAIKMSDDGKLMTVDSYLISPWGNRKNIFVYDKTAGSKS